MKSTSLLLTALLLLAGFGQTKAEIVDLGAFAGNETTSPELPTNVYYKYSLTQQLYTPDEIDFTGKVTQVGFYNESAENVTRTIDLYLVHAGQSTFKDNNDWVKFTDNDKVFSGEVTFKSGDWTYIKLSKDFYYSKAIDTLAVVIDDNTGSYRSGGALPFKAYTTPRSSQALSYASDSNNPDATNYKNFSGTLRAVKNQILFRGSDDPYLIAPIRSDELPLNSNAAYSMSEQIYTKEEIGKGGSIKSISLYKRAVDKTVTRNIDIYLGETSEKYLPYTSSWITASKGQKVFSGNVTFADNDWTTITFTTPFDYSGEKNLFVIVDDNTGNEMAVPSYFLTYRTPATEYGQALTVSTYNDSGNLNPDTPGDGNVETIDVKNRIKLDIAEGSGSEIVEIGSGENTCDYLPAYSFYNYSLTQQIYTKSEIGSAKTLTSLSLYNAGEEKTRNMDLYLVHTDKSSFNGSTDWVGFSQADKVFSGTVTFEEDKWTAIGFNREFEYNGQDNLILVVDDNTASYSSGLKCRVFGATGQALYAYSDGTDYDADNLAEYDGTVWDEKNQIRFNEAGIDIRPASISVSAITKTSALVKWESTGSMWNLQFKKPIDEEWVVVDGLTSKSIMLNDLESGTTYLVRVQIDYGGGNVSGWIQTQFSTLNGNVIPTDLSVSVSPTAANIRWTGTSDRYLLRYRVSERDEIKDIVFFEDFEGLQDNALPEGWTAIDADIDGYNWYTKNFFSDEYDMYGKPYAIGNGCAISDSYDFETYTPLTPDNWLISPQLDLQGTLHAWIRAKDPFPDEHFAIYLSTTGKDIQDFNTVLIPESTATGTFVDYTADLSAYTGKKGYVAIRHFNVTNMYQIFVDNFGIYNTDKVPAGDWQIVETTEPEVTLTDLKKGTTYDYQITGIKEGEEDAVTDIFTFTTPLSFELVLRTDWDNHAELEENDGRCANVTISGLTLKKDGTWQTLCLPFDLNVSGSVLEGADVRPLNNAWVQDSYIILDFSKPVDYIEANTMYLIRWSGGSDIVDPTFEDVTIRMDIEQQARLDVWYSISDDSWTCYDMMSRCIYSPANGYMDSDVRIYHADGSLALAPLAPGMTVDAFSCIFELMGETSQRIKAIGLYVGDLDETITGIMALPQGESPEAVYNLAGQRLNKARKGINIKSGKKVLVK